MTRVEAGTLLRQTMGLVAITSGLFAVGAYLGRNLSYQWGWLGFIAAFGCLIAMNLAVQRSQGLTVALLFGFGLLIRLATRQRSATAPARALFWALIGLIVLDILNVFLLLLSRLGPQRD